MRAASPLFRRYVRILMVWMGGLTCAVGLIHMSVVASAQRRGVAELLGAEASTASERIQSYLNSTVDSLRWIDDFDQPGTPVDDAAIRDAGYQLLRRQPSVIGLTFFDGNGCRRLSISRQEPDTRTDCSTTSPAPLPPPMFSKVRAAGVSFGDVFFPDGSEPHLYIGVASRGRSTGALVAEVNLEVIHDSVASIHVGTKGIGFVVDNAGRLIAHPDEALVLRQTQLPPGFGSARGTDGLSFATDFARQRVVTASRALRLPSWRVVVEEPVNEALAPVYAALWTTGGLVLAALLGSLVAGYIVAVRLTQPLSLLRAGAARIARGDLTTRLRVKTGDEIEEVADGFNRMAEALADSRAHLEAKVADRTAALQDTTRRVQQQAAELAQLNSALARSLNEVQGRKDEAERANAAKTRFLAVASHDLRQPMHAISLLVGILSEKIRYPEVRNIVQKIQGSVDAMEDLFGTLLDISKLDAGAIQPTLETFPIANLFDGVKRSFEPTAEQKGLALEIDTTCVLVRSDPALLERVLFNLVSNAIRYTRSGYVRLRCELGDEVLRIIVEDTGIGIPEEHHQRIYDEFFQVTNGTGGQTNGLGLGLSIVKRCAELLGHRLSMQSSPAGSQFCVEVPCAGVKGGATGPSPESRAVSERLAGAFVVVIDDDPGSRFAAEATYSQWGCRVLALNSVERTIAALDEHLRSPDLVVSDFELGEQWTGLTAIEALRARTEDLIPAIIVTGDISALSSVRLDDHCVALQKPVGSERLKEASERLLNGLISGNPHMSPLNIDAPDHVEHAESEAKT
ncbi:MAG TPA: ATP-binding protein [Steroidobacteraceae bacterium]|nr:ATP-binding protein [Steroidobacteraceae bacterium]